MERCPVCGSPVRSGANFCTACGHRLTTGAADAVAPVASSPPSQATAEPVAPDAAPTVQAVATAVEDPVAVPWTAPLPDNERREVEADWAPSPPLASADLWPSPERAADRWGQARTDAATVGGEPAGDGYPSWDAAPSSWGSWNSPPPAEPEASVEDASAQATPDRQDDDGTLAADAEPFARGDDSGPASETEPEAPLVPAMTPDQDATQNGWEAYLASRDAARATAAEGDVVARGLALVDQLRDLLPALVFSEPATMQRVANDLATARDEADATRREDLDRLRGVLAVTREKPRDIDALVELGNHATELMELVTSYERYAGAIDRAVDELLQRPVGAEAIDAGADELPATTDDADGLSATGGDADDVSGGDARSDSRGEAG